MITTREVKQVHTSTVEDITCDMCGLLFPNAARISRALPEAREHPVPFVNWLHHDCYSEQSTAVFCRGEQTQEFHICPACFGKLADWIRGQKA